MKSNVIRLNIMHLNSVHLNSIGEVQSVSLKAGESTEDPVYPPTTYTLAANVSNGKVTATKNGTSISLPYVATEGDVIALSVTPDEGYEFNGWLDGNKSNPRTVTMTGNVVLSASCVEIAKPTYTLSASVTNGKVSAKRNGSAVNLPFTANEGDTIMVSVTPNDGYAFEGWNDGNTDNPRSITMNADVALSAQCVEVVQPPVGNYIQFEDKAVEAICVANWSSDGIGLTEEDAAKVEEIPNSVFRGNKEIVSFNELQYFTGLKYLGSHWEDDKGTFAECTSLKSVVIPMQVTDIRHQAFRGCTSLESVNISHLTNIGSYSFRETAFKGEVYCPNLQSIGYSAFARCKNLTKVVDLGKVTDLRGAKWEADLTLGAFAQCASLESVIINDCVESIGYNMLYASTALQSVITRATTPPTLANVNAFTYTNNCPIYVPDASLEAYKTATNWNTYADRIHPLSEIEGVVIEDGYELNSNGTLKESANYFVVGFIGINGGESITWGMSSGAIGLLCEYDGNGNVLDYWSGQGRTSRTITTKSASKQIKACFLLSQKDSAYILDNTNGKYLWKGANVE